MKHRRIIRNVSLSCRTAPPCEVCIVPCKTAHKSSACVSSSWCLNQRLRLFPKRHVSKTLASSLNEKATAVIKRVKDYEHTSQCVNQRKRRAGNLSRFHGTKPVIFKPVISGSNMVGLPQHLTISFLT